VNVWCAAGKKTFSTDEIIRQVKRVRLAELVKHRTLILPQLGAPGVSAHLVSKGCGFKTVWGPIRAGDISAFLKNNQKAEPEMRRLTFGMWERLILVPVEISLILKPSFGLVLALFALSGICPEIFSLGQAWDRGLMTVMAYGFGVIAGAVLVPALLPWLPGRSFYIKGLITGLLAGFGAVLPWIGRTTPLEWLALPLISMAVSSYAAMNFTGATPFTSPSGVEREMRFGIPLQLLACLVALAAWIGSPFLY